MHINHSFPDVYMLTSRLRLVHSLPA
jgi:hypothetical protein